MMGGDLPASGGVLGRIGQEVQKDLVEPQPGHQDAVGPVVQAALEAQAAAVHQGSPVGGGHIGLAALHRLDTALCVAAQDHGLVARGGDLLLQPPDQGDGDVPLVGGETLGGALGIGQGGLDDGGAVDEAQLGAQAGDQMHPHEHIIGPAEEHLPRALPVAAEGIFQIQPRLAGKIPEDGHQHAGGRALHAVGIGRGIFGAQHPEGAHAVQNALLAVAEDKGIVDHAEIGIVKGILQVGVHLVDAGDGLVQGADEVGVPLGGGEIIGPGSELGHDPAVGDGGDRETLEMTSTAPWASTTFCSSAVS